MRESLPRLLKSARSCALLVATCLLCATGAAADTMTIDGGGEAIDQATFIPFGGLTQDLTNLIDAADGSEGNPLPAPRFQQVYDASAFSELGPISIEQISFFASIGQPDANPAVLGGTNCSVGFDECGLFTIQMSTTTLDINGLSETNFLSNLQGGQQLFSESVLLTGSFAEGVLSFSGTPYTYDPEDGNLIIDFQILDFATSTDLTQNLGKLFFDGTRDDGESPAYSVVDNFDGLDNIGFGLVTGIDYQLVPEPSTGLLLAMGLAGFGFRSRRKRG
jgi:hypothetical protein